MLTVHAVKGLGLMWGLRVIWDNLGYIGDDSVKGLVVVCSNFGFMQFEVKGSCDN